MAKSKKPTKAELKVVDSTVDFFVEDRKKFVALAQSIVAQIQNDDELMCNVHSLKFRVKDPDHLRGKLIRKLVEAKSSGADYDISPENLYQRINDLAGIRILHLHTTQVGEIHKSLLGIFDEQHYKLVEEPTANCWDEEFASLFSGYGIETRSRDSMYTTIHYVVEANQRSRLTCEIQVRTLMDEVWGEVSHTVNYPTPSESSSCENQLKILARLTSGCVRLVDSIFETNDKDRSTEWK
jgi:ppGpp synthetase/RelA/SpoT-type nucleotidyltranferase